MIFDVEIDFEVRFLHFLTPPHLTNLQNSMISLDYRWFWAKNLSNIVSLPWKLHNRYFHSTYSLYMYFDSKLLAYEVVHLCLS